MESFLLREDICGIASLSDYAMGHMKVAIPGDSQPAMHFDNEAFRRIPHRRSPSGAYIPPSEEALKSIRVQFSSAIQRGTAVFRIEEPLPVEQSLDGAGTRCFVVALYGLERLIKKSDQPPYIVIMDGTRAWGRQPWDQRRPHLMKTPPVTADHSAVAEIIAGAFQAIASESRKPGVVYTPFMQTSIPVPLTGVPGVAGLHAVINAHCADTLRSELLRFLDAQGDHAVHYDPRTSVTTLNDFWGASTELFRTTTMWTDKLFELDFGPAAAIYRELYEKSHRQNRPQLSDAVLLDHFQRILYIEVFGDDENREILKTIHLNIGKMLSSVRRVSDSLHDEIADLWNETINIGRKFPSDGDRITN